MPMDACKVIDSHSGFGIVGAKAANYRVIDGFELAGPARPVADFSHI
jgi:hypothetical protein